MNGAEHDGIIMLKYYFLVAMPQRNLQNICYANAETFKKADSWVYNTQMDMGMFF